MPGLPPEIPVILVSTLRRHERLRVYLYKRPQIRMNSQRSLTSGLSFVESSNVQSEQWPVASAWITHVHTYVRRSNAMTSYRKHESRAFLSQTTSISIPLWRAYAPYRRGMNVERLLTTPRLSRQSNNQSPRGPITNFAQLVSFHDRQWRRSEGDYTCIDQARDKELNSQVKLTFGLNSRLTPHFLYLSTCRRVRRDGTLDEAAICP